MIIASKEQLPPLYIKLSLMERFSKAWDKQGISVKNMCIKFAHLVDVKQRKSVFIGSKANDTYEL